MEMDFSFLENLAKEIARNDERLLQTFIQSLLTALHEQYVRPLQESSILKNVEVARRLHVSPSTVTQLIETGKLPTTSDWHATEYHLWQYITHKGQTILSGQHYEHPSSQLSGGN